MWISLVVGTGLFVCLSLLALSILFFVLKKRGKAKKSIISAAVLFTLLLITAQIFGEDNQTEEEAVDSIIQVSPNSSSSPSPSPSPIPTPAESEMASPTPSAKAAIASASPKTTSAQKSSTVNTEVFGYAESVEVEDNRAKKNHLAITVTMLGGPDGPSPGLATEHVIIQAYDFLQQNDLKDAKTITLKVVQDKNVITQISVQKEQFIPGEYFINSVLDASTIEYMSEDVKEYGKVMERW